MLSDEQIKDLWNKIQNQKDYSFTGGVRVIEQVVRNATLEEVAQKVKDLRCEDRAWLSDYEQGVQQGNSDMLDEIDNELRQMKEEE